MTKIRMYSPVPTPTGTKETYWETKAPGSEVYFLLRTDMIRQILIFYFQVLGIGKNVPANNYAAFSILAALVGAYSIQEVALQPAAHNTSHHHLIPFSRKQPATPSACRVHDLSDSAHTTAGWKMTRATRALLPAPSSPRRPGRSPPTRTRSTSSALSSCPTRGPSTWPPGSRRTTASRPAAASPGARAPPAAAGRGAGVL